MTRDCAPVEKCAVGDHGMAGCGHACEFFSVFAQVELSKRASGDEVQPCHSAQSSISLKAPQSSCLRNLIGCCAILWRVSLFALVVLLCVPSSVEIRLPPTHHE